MWVALLAEEPVVESEAEPAAVEAVAGAVAAVGEAFCSFPPCVVA